MRREQFGKVCDLFTTELPDRPSADQLRTPWVTAVAAIGAINEVGEPITESGGSKSATAKFPVIGERGGFAIIVSADDEGRLWGLYLAPLFEAQPPVPWLPPDYTNSAAFTESDLTVGNGPLALPGTLSVPAIAGPLPSVVLLPGSGPMDRDSTLRGGNKPLKDIAWGIASRGIAVLRFDKVTHTHPDLLVDDHDATLQVEYIEPAMAAIRLLREHPSVDPDRIFLLGHSEGATVAPRIAAIESDLAGLILLAGAASPPHHTLVRQCRYLASLHPDHDVETDPTVVEVTRQATLIDSPDFSATTPAADLPFQLPAIRWLEMRDYDPVATAARLRQPMLILQGGRDYQVTVADDLAGWRRGLGDRDDVTIQVHDADNHQFFSGSGPSTPGEYIPPQHVDPVVVTEIVTWILAR